MEKLQQLTLMDKIIRELEDLKNSQTAVLKKVTQIEADNITHSFKLLDQHLPDLHEEVNSSVETITELQTAFEAEREEFFTKNNLAAQLDPTV